LLLPHLLLRAQQCRRQHAWRCRRWVLENWQHSGCRQGCMLLAW
jgi:hypothetical protein